MSEHLRQPSDIPWGAGALVGAEVNGSNQVVLSPVEVPIPSCVFWDRTGSNAELITPEIGPIGTILGAPTFGPGKFGNGVENIDQLNHPRWPDAQPAGVSIIEWWWEPAYAHGAAGSNIIMWTRDAVQSDRLQVIHSIPTYRLAIFVRDGGVFRIQYRYNSITWTAGVWYHMLIIMDSAAGAQNRVKLYKDTVLQVPTAYTTDATYAWAGPVDVTIGEDTANVRPNNSMYDNLKIYNSAADLAAIFANRNNESWPTSYTASGSITSPVIDCGAGKRPFLVGWTPSAYVDDERIGDVRIRGSNDAPTSPRTGSGRDDDGVDHDYWSAPVWSPQDWETLTQDVQPVTWYRYMQIIANLVPSTDAEDTPTLETLRMLFRDLELARDSTEIYRNRRIKNYHLEVGGYDLAGGTSTLKFPSLTMNRGRGSAGLKLSNANFQLDNSVGAFNVGNLDAWLAGQDVYGLPIDAWLEFTAAHAERFDLWRGIGKYIKEDERRRIATLYGIQLHKAFTGYKVIGSGNNTTPAQALRAELINAGWVEDVDWDEFSFAQSEQRQADAAIYINYDYSAAGDAIILSEFIRRMATIGCADVYFFGGRLYYRTWTPFVSGVAADLTWFEQAPLVDRAMKNYYNDYRIDHSGGSTETDAGNNNIGDASRGKYGPREFKQAETAQLEVVDAAAAVGLGELYIRRDLPRSYGGVLTPLANVACTVDIAYLKYITLDSFVSLTWARSGFDQRVFEVIGMTIDCNRELLHLKLREAVRS